MDKKTLYGAIAALFLLPLAIFGYSYKKVMYGLDFGSAKITARELEEGKKPSSHNVTIEGGVVDGQHSVTWILTKNGSEESRYTIHPMRAEGGSGKKGKKGKKEAGDGGGGGGGKVKIILTSDDETVPESGDFTGVLRDLDGDGVSKAVIDKFAEEGVKVDDKAVLVQLGASTKDDLLSVLFIAGCAEVAPIAVLVVLFSMSRKEKDDGKRAVKLEELRKNVPPDLAALEAELFQAMLPFARPDLDSYYVYSFTAVGPFKVTVDLDGQSFDAPPNVFTLVQRIHECYRKHGAKVEGVNYYMEKRDDDGPWKLRATAR